MQVHGSPGILSCLQGIDELLGYCLSEAHVVTAASPQPALTSWKSAGGGKVVEQVVRILLAAVSNQAEGLWDGEGLGLGESPVSRLVSA